MLFRSSRFLQTRGCAKQKSLQRPPTIRYSEAVSIVDEIPFNFYGFEVKAVADVGVAI